MKDCCMIQSKRLREPLFDIVKALMMIWVIWGHLGRYGIVHIPEDAASIYMANAKICVNMPIFFVISGYFAAFTFAKTSLARCIARSICMMWPQIVYAFCCASAIFLLTGGSFFGVFERIMTFWFLRCIAIIYLISAILTIFIKRDLWRWSAFGIVYCALLFWPSRFHVWWMDQLIHMLPYFVFGLMVLSRHELFKRSWISLLCGLLFVATVFLEGDSSTNGMNFWNVTAHWRVVCFHLRDFITFFARTAVGIAGSVFVLWAVDRAIHLMPSLKSLAVFGTTSLGVYVIHEWVIMVSGSRFSLFPFPEWTRLIVAICYFLICHLVVITIKGNKLTRVMFFGDEKWLEKLFQRR